ncbi:diguanylate cyclase [Caldimonas sp. KR1-144]|uniref:GGDEF domain-containing protein n=1 Tax=Caldimonas sp. KR1-144 TaxID=3400911 RepID=UPI003BFE76AD
MRLTRLFRLLTGLLLLPVAATLAYIGVAEWKAHRAAQAGVEQLEGLRSALTAAEMASRERGPANGVLGDGEPADRAKQRRLAEARERTDRAFDDLERRLGEDGADGAHAREAERIAAARRALREARRTIDGLAVQARAHRAPADIQAAVERMFAVIPMLGPTTNWYAGGAQAVHPELSDAIIGARLAADLREYAGQLGSHFTAALTAEQPFTRAEQARIDHTRGRIDQLHALLRTRLAAEPLPEPAAAAAARLEERYFGRAQRLLEEVMRAGADDGRYGLDTAEFAARYVPDMNPIVELRDALLDDAMRRANADRDAAGIALAAVIALLLTVLAALATLLIVIRQRIVQPLAESSALIAALADGDLEREVPEPVADDEIADILRATQALKQRSLERHVLALERDGLIAQLREQSNTDFLTGLPNRRAFFEAATRELAQARRHLHSLSLMMLDLDHFKRINDTYGHAAGDEVLKAVAARARVSFRLGDVVARYGGEEFVVLLPHCPREEAIHNAERLRQIIAELVVPLATRDRMTTTVSIGVAVSTPEDLTPDTLCQRADRALYHAKRHGRNRVAFAALDGIVDIARYDSYDDDPPAGGITPDTPAHPLERASGVRPDT